MRKTARRLSPGTRDDLAGGASLAALSPFFSSPSAARRFVELAVLPHLSGLRAADGLIACVDVGGGEGILAAALAEAAAEAGIPCEIIVVDQNALFLQTAARRGLRTLEGGPSDLPESYADLALMRFVNHYDSASAQVALARDLAGLVRPGGLLAAQIQTATAEICAVFDTIAALLSGDPLGVGRHWPTLPEFLAQFEAVGFETVTIIGGDVEDQAPASGLVMDAWSRVHGIALRAALTQGDVATTANMLAERERFAQGAHEALQRGGAPDQIATTQPITVMRRSSETRTTGDLRRGGSQP
ncbi:methyltransferase domain-containing protein [Sinorhizobium medicae]|nr:methyltransferase domain-containing protein [Sinorhizobium medicae]